MRTPVLAAIAALATLTAAPALAQAPAAPSAASAKLSVETSTVADIIKVPAAKAALEKAVPQIPGFYDQIGSMTLTQIAPMSQGALDDAKLKALQAEFDAIK